VIGKIAIAASMVLLAIALVFLARAPAPQAATGSFYAEYLKVQPRGIPGDVEREQLQPLLSARLNALLKDGEDAEKRYREATKGDVPPLVEGDVFTSLFEGATAYRVRNCQGDDTTRLCPVSLAYRRRGEPETRWVDAVALVRETGGWRVDDIIYGGNWDFAKRGRLTELLRNAIAESKKPVG
jgi:hypothetical protein